MRLTPSLRCGISCGAIVSVLLVAAPAIAQDNQSDEAPASSAGGITSIVVTAQRYEQELQETPLSIVAIDSEQLTRQGTDSLSGFDSFVPNLTIGGTAAQGNAIVNVAIRGIGGAPQGFITQEGAVGVYIDDILYARPNGALLDLLDVERVEVLRGPQGTLFGRNTAGGAIRYVTKQPANDLQGRVSVTAGSRDRFDVTGMINIPLSDTLATRFSFAKKSRDGFIRRVIDDSYVGGGDSTTMRGQLRWEPTDRLEVSLAADLIRTSDNGQPSISTDFSADDLYPAFLYGLSVPGDPPANPAAVASLIATAPASVSPSGYTDAASDFAFYYDQAQGPYEIYGGLRPDLNDFESYGLSGIVSYDLTDTLEIKLLTGFRDIAQVQEQDWDRTPIPLVQVNERTNIEYFSQEIQLSGLHFDDRFNWVAGLFYYDEKSENLRRRFDPAGGANSPSQGDVGMGSFERKYIETESIAVFGQGTFAITEQFSATVGLRWSRDEKYYEGFREGRGQICLDDGVEVDAVGARPACPPGSVSTPSTRTAESSWSSVSPRFALEYRWTPDVMTYVSAAMGYKGGGFNDAIQSRCYRSPQPDCGLVEFDAENLWTYEVGLRSDLFDRRVRFNITGFLTKYSDQQIQLADPGPPPLVYTVNGDSTVKGIEAELLVAPIDNLLLRGSFGYIDSAYDEDIAGLSGTTVITPAVPFYRSPEWSYTLGASYEYPLGDAGEFTFDINWGWKDEQASFPSPTNFVILPSYGLLNGRIGFQAASGWSIAVFGNNLTDEYYLTGGFDPSGPASKPTPGLTGVPHDRVFGFTMLDIGRPREFGVELSYEF